MTTKKAKKPTKSAARRPRKGSKRTFRKAVGAWITRASWKQWLLRIGVAAAAFVALLVFFVMMAYASVSLPKEPEQAQTSAVLAADGSVLAELYKENREDVPLDDVSDVMQQAVIAAEDRYFYRHSGLDPVGVSRALWNDIRRKGLQGGSTITQQLVKNQYLSPERTLTRKLKEAVLAVKVERELEKDEILERYLNTVYFGRGAYGVQKAAQLYFGKDAAALELHEAALLAGLIRAPERAEPESDPDAARRRRQIVLDALVRTGVIEEPQAERAAAAELGTVGRRTPGSELKGTNGYFVDEVREWAIQQFGERLVYGGGLRIETTLDPRMQAIAERVIYTDTLTEEGDPDAALVAMDDTGAVLAMIGGRDFAEDKVNMAIGREGGNNGRQPGSTFKPLVLAAALESGISVAERYSGPAEMEVEFEGHPPYEVHNYEDTGYGSLDLVSAMTRSVNTTYAQLAADAGLENIVRVAEKLGIESEIEPFPAMSLGSEEVHPTELLRSYMTFATRGERVQPYYVRRVLQSNGVVFEADTRREEDAFPRQYADVVNHALQQVVERGTGTAARIGRPVAGKTGTTSNYVDAWFVGYTPKIGAAVWMGHKEDSLQQMTSVHGRRVSGGSFPAQIWGAFMREALEGIDTGEFVEPEAELLQLPADAEPEEQQDEEPESTTTTEDPASTTTSSTETTLPQETSSTTTTAPSSTTTSAPTSTTTAPPQTTTTTAPPADADAAGSDPP